MGSTKSICAMDIIFYFCRNICKKSCLRNDCIIKKSGYGALISITLYIIEPNEEDIDYRRQWIHRTPNIE